MSHLKHWTEGGNGVTNFKPEDTHLYAKAIDAHGDASLYIGEPIPPCVKNDRALRVRGKPKDLSEFWIVFGMIAEETKKP